MGSSLVKAVFDTNILVDLLKGRVEANNEPGRYSALAISRISWIEVLAGVRDTEDQNRVENLLGFFEIIELDEPVALGSDRVATTTSAQAARRHYLGLRQSCAITSSSLTTGKISAREIQYIRRRAAEREERFVTTGQLAFFSCESGDAWMLDPADRLACQLARDRDPQPVEFEETKTNFAIRWKGSYLIDGDAFVYADQTSGRVLVSHLS
jgi:hypothetical protein